MNKDDIEKEPVDTNQLVERPKNPDKKISGEIDPFAPYAFRNFRDFRNAFGGEVMRSVAVTIGHASRGQLREYGFSFLKLTWLIATAILALPIMVPLILIRKMLSKLTSSHEAIMVRILLLVLKPDDALERLGDLVEDRAKVAATAGNRYAAFHFWWRGIFVVLGAALDRAEPYLARIAELFKIFPKG